MSPTNQFIRSILRNKNRSENIKLVIVTHIVPGVDEFLEAVHGIFPIAAVIPKPNSIDPRVMARIATSLPVLSYTRSQMIELTGQFISDLRQLIRESAFTIIDMGGYFSKIMHPMRSAFGQQMMGIVEDTENGHQKYENTLTQANAKNSFPCPVVSVARSNLKEPEDFLVGQAIVFSAEALIREHGKIITGKHALVLGYGKIGRSIAQNLHSKGARVDVIDSNPTRQVLALSHGFLTAPKDLLLQNSDLIFCATGNHSITRHDLRKIKHNSYLFMATSADDEIENYSCLKKNGILYKRKNITEIEIEDNRFYLCNHGNSVNFVHGGVVGAFIKLVQAELVFAASQIHQFSDLENICHLSDDSKRFIADLWIEHFIQT